MSAPQAPDKQLISNIFLQMSSRKYHDALISINTLDIEAYGIEFKGKFYAWKAQCHLELKQPHKAIVAFNHAIRNAKRLGHKEAVSALREQRNIATAQATALDVVNNSNHTDPISNALRIANENVKQGLGMLYQHKKRLEQTDQLRDQIICLLAIARLSENYGPILEEAMIMAMEANDPNLISAVKQTMDHLGYRVKPHTF